MEWIKNVNPDAKVAYVLTLTEKLSDQTKNYEWHYLIRRVLNMCWEWVEEKKHSGDELFYEFDDEDEGLILIEGYHEVKENPQLKLILHGILEAI